MYEFESKDLEFGRGSLAEKIAYDRYAITSISQSKLQVGATVLFRQDNKQIVGTVRGWHTDYGMVMVDGDAQDGREYSVDIDDCRLVVETKPAQMWARWAKGAASVESEEVRNKVEDEFRWLLDGFRYTPGGRIMTMLGREFSGFEIVKSKLTAYNCLVLPSPKCNKDRTPLKNWLEILHVAKREANAMAFGSGVGINISTVPEQMESPKNAAKAIFFISHKHPESKEFTSDNFSSLIAPTPHHLVYQIVVKDSRFGIFDALIQMVELLYEGKDVLVDFSLLRPKGAYVKGIDGVSSGAVSWAKLFDFVVGLLKKPCVNAVDIAELYAFIPQLISQGGQRRGALMLVLDCDHPNIIEFIEAKQTAGRIVGANLSVNLTAGFMERLMIGHTEEVRLFDSIAKLAWQTAEPGVLFMHRANDTSNTKYYQTINAVNPCAEEPLPENGVCNLGSINLPMFVKFNHEKQEWYVEYEELARAVRLAVRFQDDIIDYSLYFDSEIEEVQLNDRRIGIGTMGLATVLIRLGIRYGSVKAVAFSKHLQKFIAKNAYIASIKLGEEKGSFPAYKPNEIDEQSFLYQILDGHVPMHLRNCALLTQAPTGSSGTMIDNLPGYNCSSGIEPYFAFKYFRAGRLGVAEQEVGLVREFRKKNQEMPLPDYFVSAQEITPEEHVRMQSAVQKYVDASISKTINLPASATVQDVKEAYLLAYETGCKGVTVYRDGSRSGQVLATKKEQARLEDVQLSTDLEVVKEEASVAEKQFKKRPRILYGKTVKQNSPFGKMYVTLNSENGIDIDEVFIHLGKVGSDIRAITDSLGIILTLALSERLSALTPEEKLKWLSEKLIGIKGANPIGFGPNRVDSLPDALGRVLKEYLTEDFALEQHAESEDKYANAPVSDLCPECGAAALVKAEGCEKCTACGASKCSG